ncbi:MAG: hypothetical protein LBO64_08260 [Desulfovibrio sp.]|nr:hypothetical protein [Desulfovibrio sp.]
MMTGYAQRKRLLNLGCGNSYHSDWLNIDVHEHGGAVSAYDLRLGIPDNAFMGWLNAGDLLWLGAFANIARLAGDAPEIEWLMGWPSIIDRYGRVLRSNTGDMFPRSIIAAGLAENCHYRFVQQESTLHDDNC